MRKRSIQAEQQNSTLKQQKKSLKQHKRELPPSDQDSESEQQNDEICFKCKIEGKLFCCDNCFRTYHGEPPCLRVTPAENVWQCPCCSQREICPICQQQVNKQKNYLMCSVCMRLAHQECSELNAEILERLKEQDMFLKGNFFVCDRCLYDSQIKRSVAIEKFENSIFHLVIPNHVSNIHKGWISDKKLNDIMLKHKRRRDYKSNEPDIKPEVDRIVSMKKPIKYRDLDLHEQIAILRDNTRVIEYGNPNNFKFLVKWINQDYENCTWEDQFVVRTNPQEYERFIRLKEFEIGYLIQKTLKLQDFRKFPTDIQSQPKYLAAQKVEQKVVKLAAQYIQMEEKNMIIQRTSERQSQRTSLMGLINHLFGIMLIENPILILSRERDIKHWTRQLKTWCNYLNIIVFIGEKDNRNIIKAKQFFYKNAAFPKFNVIITTLQIFMKEHAIFNNKEIRVRWHRIILDDENRYQLYKKSIVSHFSTINKTILYRSEINKDQIRQFIQLNQRRASKTFSFLQVTQHQITKVIEENMAPSNKTKKIMKIFSPPVIINILTSTMTIVNDDEQFYNMNKGNPNQCDVSPNLSKKESFTSKIPTQKVIHSQTNIPLPKEGSSIDIQKPYIIIRNHSHKNFTSNSNKNIEKSNSNNKINLSTVTQNISNIAKNNIGNELSLPDIKQSQSKNLKEVVNSINNYGAINNVFLSKYVWKWDQLKRITFLRFVLMFGLDFTNASELLENLIKFQSHVFEKAREQTARLQDYLRVFIGVILNCEKIEKMYLDRFFFAFNAKGIHKRILELSNLKKVMKEVDNNKQLPKVIDNMFQQDKLLLKLTLKYGIGNWKQIANDEQWKKSSTNNNNQKQSNSFQMFIKKISSNITTNMIKQEIWIPLINERVIVLLERLRNI